MKSLKEHLANQAYYFSYESKPVPTLIFHIRPEVIQTLEEKYGLKNYRIIQMKGEKIGVTEFETSFKKDIGFTGGSANNRGVIGTHLELAFPLKYGIKFLDETCKRCEGSGKDDFAKEHLDEDRDCWGCRGTGKKIEDDDSFRKVWYSIEIVLRYLSLFDGLPHLQQDIRMNCAVDGRVTDTFVAFLTVYFQKKESEDLAEKCMMGPDYVEIDSALDAMVEAWSYVDLRIDDSEYKGRQKTNCIAEVNRNGGFLVQCPGNRCFVALFRHNDNNRTSEIGHETMNHNIDTPYQELTLLIGLTVLYHEVLKKNLS